MSEEKKVNETEEKHGVELTEEELAKVNAGFAPGHAATHSDHPEEQSGASF